MSFGLNRRYFLVAAAAAPACAHNDDEVLIGPDGLPRYGLDVVLERDPPALLVQGTVSLPQALGRTRPLTIALADRAEDVRIRIVEQSGPGHDLTLTRVEAGASDLRRWRVQTPLDASPIALEFSLRFEQSTGSLFALAPDLCFVSGSAFAWYPQLVDANDTRLLGIGMLTFSARDLVVVSSGDARSSADDGRVRFRARTPDYFSFAAGRYRVVGLARDRVRVATLEPHPQSDHARRLETVLRTLEHEFGPMPRRRLDLVEAPVEAARAAGFDGASLEGFMLLIGDYFEQPFNTAFFAHEAAHQWWGGSVRRRGLAGAYLMDESLAQYGSLRTVEVLEGEAAAREYRTTGHPGYYTEYSAFWYLARTLAGIDAPLAELHLAEPFAARRVANSKGMIVWDMLSRLMGREAFRTFFSGFARVHASERVPLDVFMQALRDAAAPNAWFFDQWFTRTGAPSFSLEWRQVGSRLTMGVTQEGAVYRARLPIRVQRSDGESIDAAIDIESQSTDAAITVPWRVTDVELDPGYTVLRWTNDLRARALSLLPYTRGDVLLNQGDAAGAEAMFLTALEADHVEGSELRFQLLRGLGDAAFGQQRPREAAERYRQALVAAPPRHEATPEVWRSLGDASRTLNDTPGLVEAFAGQRRAIEALARARPGRGAP